MKPVRRFATANGCAVFRWPPRSGTGTSAPPVVLAHGMFSNHGSLRRLARRLSGDGLDVWSFDFRGHGESVAAGRGENFESVCLEDVGQVLDTVLVTSGASSVSWIGHSGGGLALLMHLARRPDRQHRLHRVALVASQATGACAGFANRLKVASIAIALVPVAGVSGPRFGLGPERETRAVMRQWCRWNLTGRWLGSDGFDYLTALGAMRVPSRVFAGAGDRFIAPPDGCRELHDALGSHDKAFTVCGPDSGFSEAFGHARILFSQAAASQLWPSLSGWVGGDPVGGDPVGGVAD